MEGEVEGRGDDTERVTLLIALRRVRSYESPLLSSCPLSPSAHIYSRNTTQTYKVSYELH